MWHTSVRLALPLQEGCELEAHWSIWELPTSLGYIERPCLGEGVQLVFSVNPAYMA